MSTEVPQVADGSTSRLAEVTRQLTAPGQLFEMEEALIRDVPTRVWKHAPRAAGDVLAMSRGHGSRDYLVYEDERITFEQHYQLAVNVGRRLQDTFGISKGDRVAIAMRNLPEWVITFWGTLLIGGIAVPLNAWWSTEELHYGLTDSASSVLVADRQRAELVIPLLGELPELRAMIWTDESRSASPEPLPAPTGPVTVASWTDWLGEIDPTATVHPVAVEPDDDATIFYTSGTTGRSKGAVGTHRNLNTNLWSLFFLNVRSATLAAEESRGGAGSEGGSSSAETSGGEPGQGPQGEDPDAAGPAPQAAYLLSVPLFHVTGCLAIMVGNTAAGGKLVMMHHFDPERALELIERERVTVFGGVPTMAMRILDSPDFARRDTSSVKAVSYGGAPAPPELVRRIRHHFPGGQPSNGYGLTETSSVTTMNTGLDYVRKPDSVGPPVPVCEVAVVPEDATAPEPPEDRDRGPEVTGELWIKGPNVVRGYWRRPEDTERVITHGWLHTGDIARIDSEGFVHIVDRAKDIIIRGGENIYSVEVEDALYDHPAVAECAVIGVAHPVLGEEVGAVVVLRPGTRVTAETLASHVGDRVARFSVPNHWWFRSEPLPRNPAGKVMKRALRDEVVGTLEAPA